MKGLYTYLQYEEFWKYKINEEDECTLHRY